MRLPKCFPAVLPPFPTECLAKLPKSYFVSDVQSINKEVEKDTDATVSCVITGISRKLDAVVWTKDGTDVTALSADNYIVSPGTYDSNSQTTTLTVKAAANTADSTFSCVITSDEWLQTNKATTVSLQVFCKECFTKT